MTGSSSDVDRRRAGTAHRPPFGDDDVIDDLMGDMSEEWRRKLHPNHKLRKDETGWVYFITVGPFVKIGWSADPQARLLSIRSACPYNAELALTILGTRWLEAELQVRFAKYRSHGKWFFLAGEVIEWVEQTKVSGEVEW